MSRITSIKAAVEAAARDAARGERGYYRVPNYVADAYPVPGGGWALTLYHYGTPILDVTARPDGEMESAINPRWWNSATDRSAIAKAHHALSLRRRIRRGELEAY